MASSKPARFLLRLVGIGCVLSMMSACERSVEAVIAEHRPAVETVFAKLKALETPARDAPPLTADKMDVGTARVVLEGEKTNALFILVHDLKAPGNASSQMIGGTHASAVATCGEALRGEFHGAAKGAEHFLGECDRAEYVFVLRQVTHQIPQLIDQQTFQPGMYEGEVLLFRLADGALLGGFRVSAASSDEVEATVDSTGISLDVIDRLESDLSSKVFVDIENKLRSHVPGVIP